MGEIYVNVDAEVVHNWMGIELYASGGGEDGTYFFGWTETGGFTGSGWALAWNSSNCPLKENWEDASKRPEGYDATYDDFLNYLATGVGELDDFLGESWTNDAKIAFMNEIFAKGLNPVACLS